MLAPSHARLTGAPHALAFSAGPGPLRRPSKVAASHATAMSTAKKTPILLMDVMDTIGELGEIPLLEQDACLRTSGSAEEQRIIPLLRGMTMLNEVLPALKGPHSPSTSAQSRTHFTSTCPPFLAWTLTR